MRVLFWTKDGATTRRVFLSSEHNLSTRITSAGEKSCKPWTITTTTRIRRGRMLVEHLRSHL
ncbi:wsv515 [White spot syndrome virus]|uniref:Wsv515 n=4 Tax=White spot syndrome virus TaxID=342409 RepID=Q8VAB1_WSSVS|nr:wsv515 [Shrimp white spot syndrome virus]AFX59876.1 wsv515 [White spot syndrome virus]AAL33516.1 wsv515 [Shrimp white spot syndrome virus]AAL88908.1 WSSV040 [Shrimp white spot syndrome virus]AWQ61048.1 wsv515 [Shrimp white spot syndrome virus]AWQ61442.1 wsv515 [Shrimp white spot syndrome virus]